MPAENEYADDFASDIAAEIGSELFTSSEETPAASEVVESKTEPVDANKVAAETSPVDNAATNPGIVPGTNSVIKPLPKSWKKEMAPLWEKADPALHEYVYSREADVMRGIQSYQQSAQQWNTLLQPFAPIFEQHPDVQPVQLMQGLMNTHLQLLNPSLPAERKLEMAKKIMADYGIDLGGVEATAVDPRIASLEQRLAAREQQDRLREKAAFDAGVAEQAKIIENFAKDPKNKYFSEVGNDIFRFIQTGAATDLQSAYELACYANPAVRAKMLAEQQVTPPNSVPAPRAKNGQFINVEGAEPTIRTRKGSIESTIENIVSAYYANH